MATLNSYVTISDSDSVSHTFGPADDLPSWAVKFLDDAARDAGLDRHPAYVAEEQPEPKKTRGRKADG